MLEEIIVSLIEWLASRFLKNHEASVVAKTQANAPMTNEEEIKDISNLPSA